MYDCTRRKIQFPMIAVMFFLVFSVFSPAQKDFNMEEKAMVRDYKRSNSYYLEGEKLFKKGKIEKAAKSFEKCLEIFPQHDKAHFVMADIYLKKRELGKAETHIQQAKDGFMYLKKWYSFTFQQYLDSLREQKSTNDEQISGLESARSTTSNSLEKSRIEARLARLKSQNTEINTKLSEFLRSGVEMPAEYNYIHGNVYFLTRRFQEAFREYNITLEKKPDHGGACNNMASLYFIHKRYDKAREYLDKAVKLGAEINPKFQEALKKAEGK